MGNARDWTREFNARNSELETFLKENRVRRKKPNAFVERAAAGRSPDLAQEARAAVNLRRVQRALDTIAGRPSTSIREGAKP